MTNQTRNQQAFGLLGNALHAIEVLTHQYQQLPAFISPSHQPLYGSFLAEGLPDMIEKIGAEKTLNYQKALAVINEISEIYQQRYETLRQGVVAVTDDFIKLYEDNLGDREIKVFLDYFGADVTLVVREITQLIYDDSNDSLHGLARFVMPSGKPSHGILRISSSGAWKMEMDAPSMLYGSVGSLAQTQYHEDPIAQTAAQYRYARLQYSSAPQTYHYPHDPRALVPETTEDTVARGADGRALPIHDAQTGIVGPGSGEKGFDPVEFKREQAADKHRRQVAFRGAYEGARQTLSNTNATRPELVDALFNLRLATVTQGFAAEDDNDLRQQITQEIALAAKHLDNVQ